MNSVFYAFARSPFQHSGATRCNHDRFYAQGRQNRQFSPPYLGIIDIFLPPRRNRQAFFLIGLVVLMISGLVAFPLARHFVKPIKTITQGANDLAGGDYAISIPVDRQDELGELARDFNILAQTLKEADSSRKRWLADISHELRTPLAILAGEIEAMLDGVRDLSRDNLNSIKEETDHLGKLV